MLAAAILPVLLGGVSARAADNSAADTATVARQVKAAAGSGLVVEPKALGDFSRDLVYTPVTICRIVNTKNGGGSLQANVTRTFDVDGTNFSAQGGNNGSCGIPNGVSTAVAMIVHPLTPSAVGSIFAWGLGAVPPASSVNFVAGQTIANTLIVPVVPGAGNDFSIRSSVATHVVIDVVGFFAPPAATALDCVNAVSAVTSVPPNAYTAVDAICPAGRTVTGGGSYPTEGTLGRPGIWIDGSPTASNGWRNWVDNQTGGNRTIQTYARCCRLSGR